MNSIAIITARGGSKRIPRKNIKPFRGIPIIIYPIRAALESGLFDEVMVSTDDDEIAEISRKAGASVPFMRSAATSHDSAGTVAVLLEVFEEYKKKGIFFSTTCCLFPTAPFITAEKLKESYQLFEKEKFDSVFPVVSFSSPIQRALRVDSKKVANMIQPENMYKRSQELEPAYHDAGQFYWLRFNKLKEEEKLWTSYSGVVVYPEIEVQDIDNPTDWKLAELKYQILFG